MTLDLEARLRTALRDEADRAPLDATEWRGRVDAVRPQRHTPAVAAATIAVIVAGCVGVAAIARDGSRTAESTPFEPAGTEYPLTSVDPTEVEGLESYFDDDLVRPGSVVVVTAGGRSLFTYDGFLAPTVGDQVSGSRCLSALRSGSDWCMPDPSMPIFFPVDPGDVRPPQFAWVNVPVGAAFVQLEFDGETRWQRPVGRVAVFAESDAINLAATVDAVITAFTDDGEAIARYDSAMLAVLWDEWAEEPRLVGDNLSAADNRRVHTTAEEAMHTCLADAGLSDPLAPAPPDVHQAWDRCLDEAQSAATSRFEQLGGEFVATAEEDPSYVSIQWP